MDFQVNIICYQHTAWCILTRKQFSNDVVMITKFKSLILVGILGCILTPVVYAAKPSGGESPVTITIDGNQLIEQIKAIIPGDRSKVRDKRDAIILHEGNDCTQELVGSLPLPRDIFNVNFKDNKPGFDNDEARSLSVRSDKGALNLPVKAGTKILLFDNPEGKKDDDWVEITFKRNPKNQGIYPGDAYCIRTFEKDYEDNVVRIDYHEDNGLNGKVSYAEVRQP